MKGERRWVYTGIVYILGLGWVIFGNIPGVSSLLGTALILPGSAVYVVFVTEAQVDPEADVGLLEVKQKQDARTGVEVGRGRHSRREWVVEDEMMVGVGVCHLDIQYVSSCLRLGRPHFRM